MGFASLYPSYALLVMPALVAGIHVLLLTFGPKTWMAGTSPAMTPRISFLAHTGKLSCLRPGISTVLPRSIASARAMRGRVACGMITSSI